jgi:hypothetical protein
LVVWWIWQENQKYKNYAFDKPWLTDDALYDERSPINDVPTSIYNMQCVVTLLNLHKTMFGVSLPPAVCRRACVFLTLFVFVCAYRCPTHIVFGVFLRLVSCLPNVASFSGLSILDCPFGFLYHLFNYLY